MTTVINYLTPSPLFYCISQLLKSYWNKLVIFFVFFVSLFFMFPFSLSNSLLGSIGKILFSCLAEIGGMGEGAGAGEGEKVNKGRFVNEVLKKVLNKVCKK